MHGQDQVGRLEACGREHSSALSLLSASVAKRFEQQEKRLRRKDEGIEELRSELRKLQVSIITVPPEEFILSDRVQHFRDNSDWFSPDFHTHWGGYLLCLQVTREPVVPGPRGTYRLTLSLKSKKERMMPCCHGHVVLL